MTEIVINIPTWGVWAILAMIAVSAVLNIIQATLTRKLTSLKRQELEQRGFRI